MPIELQPVYDNIEAVPEPFRESFVEHEGKFHFSKPVTVEDLPSVSGLRSTMEKLKRREKELTDALKSREGIDPEAHAKMSQEIEELRAKVSGDKGEQDRVIGGLRANFDKEIAKLNDEISKRDGIITNTTKANQIATAFQKFEPATSGAAKVLTRYILDMLDVRNEDGEMMTVVLEEGDRDKIRYSKRTGKPMSPVELVEEMSTLDEFKALFKGTGMSGADMQGQPQRRMIAGKRQVTRAQLEDRDTYKQLQAEATKAGKNIMDYVVVTD